MRILGLEFGTWSVKAVELESRFRQIDLLEIHEIQLPIGAKDLTEAYRKAVSDLMARLPTNPEKIVTSLPPAQMALRFLTIPLKSRKKVEQMYRFELEDTVPFRFEDSVVEHHVTPIKEGSLVFAVLSPKKHVRAHIEWLKSIGVDPDWLTFEGMGIINLYLAQLAESDEDPLSGSTLLLDLGHSKTNLAILDQDRLESFRTLSWGGQGLTRSLASSLGISLEEAERAKVTTLDIGKPSDLSEVCAQACVSLFADLNHSLVSYQNQFKKGVSNIVLTGGASDIKGISGLIERSLGIPVTLFHPFKGLKLKEELAARAEARYGEAIGRALVFARKSPLLFNFRKDDLGKETSLREVEALFSNPHAKKLAKFATALLVVLFAHVSIAGFLAERESSTAREELRKVFQETFRSVPQKIKTSLTNDPEALKKFIDQKNTEFDQRIKMLSKKRVSALSLLRNISDSFPTETKVDVNNIELTDRSFSVEGVLYSGELAAVAETMKKVPGFSNVQLSQSGPRFTIKGEMAGR